MTLESEAICRAFLKQFENSDADALLVSGDLTNGTEQAHEAFAALLESVQSKTGKKVFVVPGNHDIHSPGSEGKVTDPAAFCEIYKNCGYGNALVKDEASCSYTADLGDGYRLIAFDSCDYGEDNGYITSERYKWLSAQISAAVKDGKEPVLMMHHSLLKHYAVQPMMKVQGSVISAFASEFADAGVRYCFTGHIHANDISSKTTFKGNKIYDIMTGSLITYPNSFRDMILSGESADIRTDYVRSIDVSYLPDGFSRNQINMLKYSFSSYSEGFLRQGMSYWFAKNLGGPRFVTKMLGVKKDTAAYERLGKLMSYFGDALALPIYGSEGSLENAAASIGKEFDPSEYDYTYEIVSSVVVDFFSGESIENERSEDLKLLYKCFFAALSYAETGILTRTSVKEAVAAPEDHTSFFNLFKVISFFNMAGNFMSAIIVPILMPFLRGIITDYSAPSDLIVKL